MARQEPFERARDELFSHILRCAVIDAVQEAQEAWMNETIEYIADRYPSLEVTDLIKLKKIGMQFCQPVINRLRPLKKEADMVPEAEPVQEAPMEATP